MNAEGPGAARRGAWGRPPSRLRGARGRPPRGPGVATAAAVVGPGPSAVGPGGREGEQGKEGDGRGRGQILSSLNSSDIKRNGNESKPPKPRFE